MGTTTHDYTCALGCAPMHVHTCTCAWECTHETAQTPRSNQWTRTPHAHTQRGEPTAAATPSSTPIPEMANIVETTGSVSRADGFEGELGLELAQLQQHHGQVVHEEQGIHQRDSVLHHPLVVAVPRVQDAYTVEKPVGDDEEEDKHHEQRSEDEDAREEGFGATEEESPAAQQEDEEFEGHGDEEPLAGCPAGLQLLPPQQLG